MKTALIGHTGFVGGNIAKQNTFDYYFSSKNITEIKGDQFDLLIIAAPSAVKWQANQDPETDWTMISNLMEILKTVTAKQVVHISTVDVYMTPREVDESTLIQLNDLQPYGKHRFLFEEFSRKHFPKHLIVRLPGLFGDGLKKNVIYDFIHDNCLDMIHKESILQFYSLENIWKDISIALKHNLSLINFATEPTSVTEIARECFKKDFTNITPNSPASYNMKSQHAALYGGSCGYLYNKKTIFRQINQYVDQYAKL